MVVKGPYNKVATNKPADARGPAFIFADIEQGQKVLTQRDDFIQRLSAFDRSARVKTDQSVSEEQYLQFIQKNVRAWTQEEKTTIESLLSTIQTRIDKFSLPLPEPIYLVKTTGDEEGGAAYTRGNAIVLSTKFLAPEKTERLGEVLAHEIFHVLSLRNPELKESLYEAIGFQKCGEVALPAQMAATKITNPDAPKNDHCIHLQVDGVSRWAIPVIFSRDEKYDTARGGEFFEYLQFKFLLIQGDGDQAPSQAVYDENNVELVDLKNVSGFFEQVGKNTNYIIHPEEILAENFSMFLLGKENLPSPEIINRIEGVLTQKNQRRAPSSKPSVPT